MFQLNHIFRQTRSNSLFRSHISYTHNSYCAAVCVVLCVLINLFSLFFYLWITDLPELHMSRHMYWNNFVHEQTVVLLIPCHVI